MRAGVLFNRSRIKVAANGAGKPARQIATRAISNRRRGRCRYLAGYR